MSDIPADAFVTDDDTKSLRRAHRRADRIIEYAADVKLIASFHYRKRNFHLVRLLEPIFIVGRRIDEIKGYYFTLLDDAEAAAVTPVLERLLAERSSARQAAGGGEREGGGSGGSRDRRRPAQEPKEEGAGSGVRRRSRRRWTNRPKETS